MSFIISFVTLIFSIYALLKWWLVAKNEFQALFYSTYFFVGILASTIYLINANILRELKKLPFISREYLEHIVAKEVRKQIPDTDKVFKIFGLLITVIGILFAGLIAIVITSLKLH